MTRTSTKPRDEEATELLVLRGGGRQVQGRWLWRDLSLTMSAGCKLGITGPSGSGKTLLFRALAALDRLDEGEIAYRGRALEQWSLPEYRSKVVYLLQTPALMEGSVRDNLRAVFDLAVHQSRAYDEGWVAGRLRALGRDEDLLERQASALSGGERQIVAFLRALQVEPEVLLLDEPTANLDAQTVQQIEALVAGWLDEDPERATIWTSHHTAQLERVTDRRIELGRGGLHGS